MDMLEDIELRTLIAIGLGTLTATWLLKRYMARPKNLPPGPPGLPLLGNLVTLLRSKEGPLEMFTSWAEKYGDILSFRVGPKTVVMLNTYKVIRESFQNPNLNDRLKSIILEEVAGIGDGGIALSNGEMWKEQRHFVHAVFRSLGVGKKSYEDTIAAEVAQLAGAIEDEKGTPFDPNDLFCNAVANVICTVVFGTQYKYSDAEFRKILHQINTNLKNASAGGIALFMPIPGISKFPFGPFREMAQNIRDIVQFLDEKIESHQSNFDPDNPRDFIDLYLKKIEDTKGTGTSFNSKNLNSSIADLFLAGTESTSTTLKWAVLHMMISPEVQSRVQEELDRVVGRDRLPRLDDRPNLPYTAAVLQEIHRMSVVAPFGVPHVAAAETTVSGYTIPKGTILIPNIWKVMRDEELWEQASVFRPERFLTADGKLIKPEELIIFSTGRRVCLGEQLARMEAFLFFTHLVHRFTFKKPEDSPPLSLEGVLGLSRNTHPFKTCVVKRDS